MILVHLDAGLELLQIRKQKTKNKRRQTVAKETSCQNYLTTSHNAKNVRGTKLAVLKIEQLKSASNKGADKNFTERKEKFGMYTIGKAEEHEV